MATNILGIGISNAIGFRRKNLGGGHISYPGLIAAWSAKGKTNEDADRNVLKDLTGNGHDITLNNFAYSGMSGYGGYNINFLTFGNTSSNLKEKTSTKIIVNGRVGGYIYYIHPKTEVPSFKIKISGLVTDYTYVDENNIRQVIRIKEGEHILPKSYASDTITTYCGFMNPITSESTENGIIELIPEYPDALVFDGVDDYGVNENMPILEDFTLIINKNDIAIPKVRESFYISKSASVGNGAFILGFSQNKKMYYSSYGTYDLYDYKKVPILYITPNSFNGSVFSKGNAPDTEILTIGSIRPNDNRAWKGAIYSAYLFDKSLDDQEIKSFIRKHIDPEYLLPSEMPTPDVYYDFTNGDNSKGEANNVITDLSGNGNDATAHNFAWNEESGYAEGGLKFDGVDDYVRLDAFNRGFKTVFSLFTPLKENGFLYDQRGSDFLGYNFAIATFNISDIAYSSRNKKGTYINNVFNTKLKVSDLLNKKHLVHVLTDSIETTPKKVHMGTNFNKDNDSYGKIVIHKFLGFKESLTEEQIKAVINKYNLLDGVDNIDVN